MDALTAIAAAAAGLIGTVVGKWIETRKHPPSAVASAEEIAGAATLLVSPLREALEQAHKDRKDLLDALNKAEQTSAALGVEVEKLRREVYRLRYRIGTLEKELASHGIPVPAETASAN